MALDEGLDRHASRGEATVGGREEGWNSKAAPGRRRLKPRRPCQCSFAAPGGLRDEWSSGCIFDQEHEVSVPAFHPTQNPEAPQRCKPCGDVVRHLGHFRLDG